MYKFDVLEPPPADRRRRKHRMTLMTLQETPLLFDDPEPGKSTTVTLQKVLDDPRYAGVSMEYLYDFGDNWDHTIDKIGTESGNGVIKCVAGKGHGAAEDSGGAWGWDNLKSVYRKVLRAEDREAAVQNLNKEERSLMEWFEESCANGDSEGLDPNEWSIYEVNEQLANL